MSGDYDQFCLREGQTHEPHCVEDQGHWHCPGQVVAQKAREEVLTKVVVKSLERSEMSAKSYVGRQPSDFQVNVFAESITIDDLKAMSGPIARFTGGTEQMALDWLYSLIDYKGVCPVGQ